MKLSIRLVSCLSVICLVFAGTALADEAEEVTVSGVVAVASDDAGEITAVTITTPDGDIFNVVLFEQIKELASSMDGEAVEVTGVVTETDGVKSLTITSVGGPDPEPEAEAAEVDTEAPAAAEPEAAE